MGCLRAECDPGSRNQLPPQEKAAIGTGCRDALVRWAREWDLPKTAVSRASGLARTTIDRILKP
ncbi:hypothetical protein [Streptomyces parvus]|uniref:hypothetical protein n=1 Tax=Streptomyces parvus TaxID=66428 RepID=UPI002101BB56|nr:hypothetical protein [Streptomyces parvus]MCQ1582697.1 hypothetical protein [Streptomyces parvus]